MSHSGNVMLGFVFSVQNPQLQIECFGSPHEVCSYLAERGFQFGEVFDHAGTTVEVQEAIQDQPLLRIHGGPHAEELLALVEALDANDAIGQEAGDDERSGLTSPSWRPIGSGRGHASR